MKKDEQCKYYKSPFKNAVTHNCIHPENKIARKSCNTERCPLNKENK